MKLANCHALVTGASAGIGREFARQLAKEAATLVLVARRKERLDALRDELLRRKPRLTIHVQVVDLADQSQIDQLVTWLNYETIAIDLLVNNAGLGDLGSFDTADPARIDRMIQVNMTALTLLTRKLLPSMKATKRGAILNVSSSAGFLPIPGFAVYAATKAYVNSFSEALRAELKGAGVTVCALCPGPVHTEFMQVADRPGRPHEHSPEVAHVSAERVVRDALVAVEQDKPVVIPGFIMKLGMTILRLMPISILRFGWRFAKRR